ncbi:unnamed protein product [Paramecium pentaurelia]|uniref:B box-type domain-containing protein n=1 Tax=Paramecium pentaurelia TaxID=43138 RepID=A0A8S1VYZ6_9CILI|nr:unnamed protein product [Paramecium pentaurelia]
MNQNRECQHHEKVTELFCETCKDLVCNDCVSYGPHQTKNHKIISFKDAYTIRQAFIKDRIETAMKNKKENLLDQLEKIETRMKYITEVKATIVKDIHMEFEGGILKRLNDQSGTLTAVLQKDIAWLQKHLNSIDDFIHTFEYLAMDQNVLPLLFMSKTLTQQTMKLLSIIIKTEITSHPSDLPRELFDLRTKIQNSEILQQQIEFKKQVIWKCRQEKIQSLQNIKEEFFIKIEDEIYDWVRLLKKVVNTLDSLCMICTFCGCFIDVVNEQCALNIKPYEEVQFDFTGFTNEQPKRKVFGTCQHFFGYPRDEYLILRKDKYANFGDYQEQRRAAKEVYFKVFRSLWFSIIDLKARRYLKQLDLQAIFKKYDPDNKGWLSIVKFKYLMHQELGMSVQEIEKLVIYFRDEKEDKVNYEYFLGIDWYLEELQRLEEQVKTESVKYAKLYNRRVRAKTTSPPQRQEAKIVEKPQQQSTIYSSFTRFSQAVEKQPVPQPVQYEQPRFGFVDRDNSHAQSLNKQYPQKNNFEFQAESSLKSKQKSSSLQPKRVQFEEKQGYQRFKESAQISGNYAQKYYN